MLIFLFLGEPLL